jgi:hypothetical protein
LWVPAVVGGLILAVGGLGWLVGQPWLFASLGPTAYLMAHSPSQASTRPYNVIAGHLVGLCAAFAAVSVLGAGDSPSVFTAHELAGDRVLASGLALILAVAVELRIKASHPPAAATVLLITLGGLSVSSRTAVTILIGVLLLVLIGEPLRRLRTTSAAELTKLAGAVMVLCTFSLASACASSSASLTSYKPAAISPVVPSTVTERPVSSERLGSGTGVTIDELVTCAGRRQDMGGPQYCLRLEKEVKGRFPPSALRLCRHHIDAGSLIFQDPGCPLQAHNEKGASVQNVDVSDDTAFFDRYMTKAVKEVVKAEAAGLQRRQPEMLRHAELALDHASEAQREGTVSELGEGLAELREALRHRDARQWPDVLEHIRHARVALSSAAGMNPNDTAPLQGNVIR